MKIINSKYTQRMSTEYFVVDLDGPTKIDFGMQAIDVIVSSPEIDVLIGWDYDREEEFTPDNSMLLKSHDNMKEITKEMCTHFYLMPVEQGLKGRVYVCVQR